MAAADIKLACKQFLIRHGVKAGDVDDKLLDKSIDFARSSLSNQQEWTFARKREPFTTDGTDFVSLTDVFAGELGVYQSSGTDKGRLTYVTPDEYERLRLVDSARTSSLKYYTVYNNQDFYFHPLPSSGVSVIIVYSPGMADQETAFPQHYEAALAAGTLAFYGAPPPDGKYSWFDIFEREKLKLARRDKRPSARRPITLNLEDEERMAIFDIGGSS